MSTKPFKDIEQVIKNAAEGYEPPFEEAAWSKMEVLLDKEKERKRPIWLRWLLPILILGGSVGGYLLFTEHGKNTSPQNRVAEKNGPDAENKNTRFLAGEEKTFRERVAGAPVTTIADATDSTNPTRYSPARQNSLASSREVAPDPAHDKEVLRNDAKGTGKTEGRTRVGITAPAIEEDKNNQPVTTTDLPKFIGEDKKRANGTPAGEDPVKTNGEAGPGHDNKNVTVPANKALPQQKQDKSNASRFYLITAGGVEGSGVKLFSADKITPRAGLTIGYQLGKKLSVQTGFFAGSKKYTAGPGDYYPKAGTYWSMVDIIKVDANCLVFEVPLNVRYDFNPGKSLNIFATTGVSSYIMKKEGYQYTYNSSGYPHYGKADYRGNQHLFSVLKLSAGIEKNVFNTLSLHAAPAISIPFGGVGEGRVKLYSSEVMVGLRYQPLKKKNK